MGIPVNEKCMLLREGEGTHAYLDNVVGVVVTWKITWKRHGEKEMDVSMVQLHQRICSNELHSVGLKPFISRNDTRVVVLPGLRSGETSNRWQKACGKASGSISTDKDQSGTSDEVTYGKSARMANNSIQYTLFCMF